MKIMEIKIGKLLTMLDFFNRELLENDYKNTDV